MINLIKGIFVGIFNIIPGLSGSVLLIILGLYDKCIASISDIFRKPKDSFLFLFPIFIGVLLGTYLFSKIIFIFINRYTSTTFIIFTGFILGSIPHLFKESIKFGFKKIYLVPFFITFILGILMILYNSDNTLYNIENISIFKHFLIGILLSLSTIIPGISSTIILSLFNLYNLYIYSIANLNLPVLIPMIIGLVITTFLLSKIINYFLNNYYGFTYFGILGFSISTIPILFKFYDFNNISIGIFLGMVSFLITNKTFKVIK